MIFIAYLYNGIVGNSTIKGLANTNESQASTATSRGYVIGLILIASGFTFAGLPFMDLFFSHPPFLAREQ